MVLHAKNTYYLQHIILVSCLSKPSVLVKEHLAPFCTFKEKKQGGSLNKSRTLGENYRDDDEAFAYTLPTHSFTV